MVVDLPDGAYSTDEVPFGGTVSSSTGSFPAMDGAMTGSSINGTAATAIGMIAAAVGGGHQQQTTGVEASSSGGGDEAWLGFALAVGLGGCAMIQALAHSQHLW